MSDPIPYARYAAAFMQAIPHSRACGMRVEDISAGRARLSLPYRPEWLGDPERGLIHTGIIATLIDSVCGLAVFTALPKVETIATLDLRMDYLRPARPERTLFACAECYRVTRHIAFARAWAWQDDEREPVAVSQATFMRSSDRAARRRTPT